MKTFDFYLKFLFSLNFFRIKRFNFDSILNRYVVGYTELFVVLDYYNIAYDFYTLLKVWHRLIFQNLKFNIILSRYVKVYDMLADSLEFNLECFLLVDYFYTNKLTSVANMYTGFFTNFIFLKKYLLDYKKVVFVSLCEKYIHDLFYKNLIQYTLDKNQHVIIPDFVLVFGSENKIPSNAFELLSLDVMCLGIFDFKISYSSLTKFSYYFVCGELSVFMYIFLFKFFILDFIFAQYERVNSLISKLGGKAFISELSVLSFNLLYLTKYYNVCGVQEVKGCFSVNDFLLLTLYMQKSTFDIPLVDVKLYKKFFLYLYIYLYLNIVISNKNGDVL